jgi:general secretion pathway protein K
MIADYLAGLGSYSRHGPAFFRTSQDVAGLVGQAAMSSRLGTQVRCLRITVTVREGSTSFRVSAVVAPPGGAGLPPADASTATTGSSTPTTNQNSSATNATGSITSAATATTSTQTQPSLNYPFTLLEIRENDEIVGTAAPPQPASA